MAAGASSNSGQVAAGLEAMLSGIDFSMPGTSGSLADDLVDAVVEGIAARAIDDQSGASGVWLDNAPAYARSKAKAGKPVGSLGGDMLSAKELRGEVQIDPDELTMRYGTSEAARKKLEWFSNGSTGTDGEPSGAKNQPARPGLYALDETIDRRLHEVAEAAIARHLKED